MVEGRSNVCVEETDKEMVECRIIDENEKQEKFYRRDKRVVGLANCECSGSEICGHIWEVVSAPLLPETPATQAVSLGVEYCNWLLELFSPGSKLSSRIDCRV